MPDEIHPLTFGLSWDMDNISRGEWERAFGSDIIEGFGYHKAFSEAQIPGFRLGYLLGKRGTRLTVIIPFFITDFSFATLIQGRLQRIIRKMQQIFSRFLKIRMLFVGLPTAEELYIGIAKEEDIGEAFRQTLKKIREIAKKDRIGLIGFYNLSPKHALLTEHLKTEGFIPMQDYPNTVISLQADSLQGYLKSLSKNTRKDIRRRMNKSARATSLKTELAEDIETVIEDIYRLYLDNYHSSDIHFELLNKNFFLNIRRYMPESAKFFLTRDGKRIVAFNLCLVNKDTCIDKFVGFDKSLSHQYQLYYATFLHNISWCFKNGLRYYQMGITDYHPKLRLGAKLIPLEVYFRFESPLINFFAKAAVNLISPVNFDPTLKKLKGEFLQHQAGIVSAESAGGV